MPLTRCLALLAVFGALANSSPEISTPLNRLRRFPLQGTTPAARQSRFRGVPGRGCASRTSPRLLVRCAHLAECWGCLISLPSLLTRARHAVPLRPTPPSSPHIMGNHKGCPYALTPHSSLLTPHSSLLLTPHSSLLLTPHSSSLLTPHSSLLTPHSSLLTPHSRSSWPGAPRVPSAAFVPAHVRAASGVQSGARVARAGLVPQALDRRHS